MSWGPMLVFFLKKERSASPAGDDKDKDDGPTPAAADAEGTPLSSYGPCRPRPTPKVRP